jgi:hypothetical protein
MIFLNKAFFRAALCLCLLPVAMAGTGDRISSGQGPTYDFGYEINGDPFVSPLQVFDDGQVTYLQFQRTDVLPAIFAETLAGLVLLTPRSEPPYVVVGGVENRLVVKMGSRTAVIRRRTGFGPGDALAFGAAQPLKYGSRAPVPRTPDAVRRERAQASSSALQSKFPQSAGDGVEAEEEAPVIRPPKAVPASRQPTKAVVPTVQPPAAAEPEMAWKIDDKEFARWVFGRWAKEAGWRFSWDAPKDVPLDEDSFTGTFDAAIKRAMRAMAAAGANVKGCIYENKRFRVVAANEPCDAEASAEEKAR